MTMRWRMRSVAIAVLVVWAAPSAIWSQASSLQDQLNAAYDGKVLLLRNFYSGHDLRFEQNGAPTPWAPARSGSP